MMTGYTYMSRVYAVKRFLLESPLEHQQEDLEFSIKEYHWQLELALKEVCTLKLGGILGIGPYPYNAMQFDIVTYSNAIDIAMEKCREPDFDHVDKDKRRQLAKRVKN